MKLLVATHNQGKVKALADMLAGTGIDCLTLDDAGVTFDVDETGSTFIENATLKATQYAKATGMLTLADDSGLEVAALNNEPGIYTARYGGAELTQPERMQYMLTQMTAAPSDSRAARFRCVLVLADGNGDVVHSAEGICAGTIAPEPTGDNGFGYDPIFIPEGASKTWGESVSAEKYAISHRGRALAQMIPQIQALANDS